MGKTQCQPDSWIDLAVMMFANWGFWNDFNWETGLVSQTVSHQKYQERYLHLQSNYPWLFILLPIKQKILFYVV